MEIIESGYTRVSEILQIFQAYSFVDRKRLKIAQDNGTMVHEAIEAYFRGDFIPLDRKRSGYFQSFLRFLEATKVKPLYIERRLYEDQLKITGKIDLLAEIDGQNVLVDWKTGSWAHVDIWRLQGSFYRYLLESEWMEEDGPQMPDIFMFVQLDKDGGKPIVYILEYDEADLEVCKAALQCYHYFNKKPLISEGPLTKEDQCIANKDGLILSDEGK